MTTTTVPISITCPDWCSTPAQAHADDLHNLGGECVHLSPEVMVHDTAGYAEPLVERRFHDPVSIWVVTLTKPDGREAGSAMVSLDGRTLSMRQALDVAKTLVDTVATYTEADGRVEDEVPL